MVNENIYAIVEYSSKVFSKHYSNKYRKGYRKGTFLKVGL